MRRWPDIVDDPSLWDFVAQAEQLVLIVDYDGTLAPFVPDPAQAVPYPGVVSLLNQLLNLGAHVVVVTGRSCGDVLPLLDLDVPVEVWGSHGGEHLLADGTTLPIEVSEAHARGFELAATWAEEAGYGSSLERKPGCMSFHLRPLPPQDQGLARSAAAQAWGLIAHENGLMLRDFDGGLELRLPGVHKGKAVEAVLSQTGQGACVFYLGDDYTDEDGFDALGMNGISVLVRPQRRPSTALWWLKPPEELLAFFERLIDLVGDKGKGSKREARTHE